jgi:hypothetical protein
LSRSTAFSEHRRLHFVFDSLGAIVFETILSSGSNHTYTCALIRVNALIRTNALPSAVHDLESFKWLVRHETSPHRWDPPLWDHPPTNLLNTSATILRGLLATNRKLQRLAFGCLEYYLDRFTALRPFLRPEFSFKWGWGDSSRATECIGPWLDKQADAIYYYPIYDIGSPSCLKQQRILRVFWRMQLSRDITAAIDTSSIVWPDQEWKEGHDWSNPAYLCDAPPSVCIYSFEPDVNNWSDSEELDEETLNMIADQAVSVYSHLVDSKEMRTPTMLEHELLESALHYTQDAKETIDESSYWQLKKNWAASSMPSREEWDTLNLTFRSNMWIFFNNGTDNGHFHALGQHRTQTDCLQHAAFDHWRRFGFAIWSTARMASYGLLLTAKDYCRGMTAPCLEAWRNLLTQDERDAVDKENRLIDRMTMLPLPPGTEWPRPPF